MEGVNLIPWKVKHLHADIGVFVTCTISEDETIGAYYGLLVYINLSKRLLSMKECDEGEQAVSIITLN